MEKSYKRDALFANLRDYDFLAKEDDFIEVTHWYNSEGLDVMLSTTSEKQRFSLSWGEWRALRALLQDDDIEFE